MERKMYKWVSVKEAYNRIYREAHFVPTSNMKNNPDSKSYIEQEARKRALAHLDGYDRFQVDSCVKRVKECCPGVSLGDSAALQIIEHLGIFLAEAERENE